MDHKTMIISAAVATGIVAIAGGGVYFSPYLTLNNMKNATSNRNADALAKEINFPLLRISVKANVKAKVIEQIARAEVPKSAQMTMTPELIEKLVNPMVNTIITPEGIEQLMMDQLPGAKIDLAHLEQDIAKSNINMGYESVDRFVVHITDKVDKSKDVSLILQRDGLAWKLAGIDISKLVDS